MIYVDNDSTYSQRIFIPREEEVGSTDITAHTVTLQRKDYEIRDNGLTRIHPDAGFDGISAGTISVYVSAATGVTFEHLDVTEDGIYVPTGDTAYSGVTVQVYDGAYQDGYSSGYTDGYQSGYTRGNTEGYLSGQTDGYASGHTDGYNEGYASGQTDGYASGSTDGYSSGYTDGHADGYAEGYSSGSTDGYASGHTIGYNEGYSSGQTDGYSSGHTDGYNEGYSSGQTDGYASGHTVGYNEGYSSGHTDGYASGHTEGYNEGYSSGHTDGYAEGYSSGQTDGYASGYTVGYNEGYSSGQTDGYASGYTVGYDTGYASGKTDGYAEGYASGQTDGYSSGYTVGYNEGYSSGHTVGYDEGFTVGYSNGELAQKQKLTQITATTNGMYAREDGYSSVKVDVDLDAPYQSGYTSGYTEGYSSGNTDGYASGHTDGMAAQKALLSSCTLTYNDTFVRSDGWSAVTVNVPTTVNNQVLSLNIDATWMNQHNTGPFTLTPDSSYTGFREVNINTNGIILSGNHTESTPITTNGHHVIDCGDVYANEVSFDVAVPLGRILVTQNGTYSASTQSLAGYSIVEVNVSGGSQSQIVTLTQAQYNALNPPDPNIIYLIKD